MKKLSAVAVLLVALSGVSNVFADPLVDQYTVGCNVEFTGVSGVPFSELKVSLPATAPSNPSVSYDLGDYHLLASVSYAIPYSGDIQSGEPIFQVHLYKKSLGPIVGQVNLAGASGLKTMQVGQQNSVFSRSFLNIVYGGQNYSRVDYTCTIARTL